MKRSGGVKFRLLEKLNIMKNKKKITSRCWGVEVPSREKFLE